MLLFLLLFNVESSVYKHFESDRANHTSTIIAQKRPWGLVAPEKEGYSLRTVLGEAFCCVFARMWGSKFCLLKERNGLFLCLCVHSARLCWGDGLAAHGGVFPFSCLEPLGISSCPTRSSAVVITSWFRTAGLSLTKKVSSVFLLLLPGKASQCLRSVDPSFTDSTNKYWPLTICRYCFRQSGHIREQDKISCLGRVYVWGEFQPSAVTRLQFLFLCTGVLLRWQGRSMCRCPQVGTPQCQAALDQSRGGEVGRDHEKGLSPCPCVWHARCYAANNNRSSDAV